MAGLLTDFGVREVCKGAAECLLTRLQLGALRTHKDLADAGALLIGREADETGPGGGPEDREGHQGRWDSAVSGQQGHSGASRPREKLVTFVRSPRGGGGARGIGSEVGFLWLVKCQALGFHGERV